MTNKLFDDFSKVKVLIIGDVMIDRYLSGAVKRISPEAPVPVVHLNHTEDRLGGAANVALNVKALGGMAFLFSVIGDDEDGSKFKDLLEQQNLYQTGIIQSKQRTTTVKTRIWSRNQQLLRFDKEEVLTLNKTEHFELVRKVKAFIIANQPDVLLFQDYNKGVLTPTVLQELLTMAAEYDVITVVDPKKENFLAYKNVTLFKPNLSEVQDYFDIKIDLDNQNSLREAAINIRKHLNNAHTLITLSEKGLYWDTQKDGKLFPTQARNVADVCGAGDTVISVIAICLALKINLETIAEIANLAGGIVCEQVGVVPVNKKQLELEYFSK